MNWKKALLVIIVGIFALALFTVAAAGVAATAGLATAAAVISESGVVEAFEDVADGAERLQIDVDENAITFTNPDSGERRTVTSGAEFSHGRVTFDLPQVTVTDGDGQRVVVSPRGDSELPEITITDPDNGQSRVIRPSADFHAPRVVWDSDHDGLGFGLRLVGGFLRGLFTLTVLLIIAAGAYLLLRNRRQSQDSLVDEVKKES